jgi:hypothetical protein
MNAFSTPTGPSLFSVREFANAQRPMRDHTRGQAYWSAKSHPFCTQIPSQQERDKSNSIKGRE